MRDLYDDVDYILIDEQKLHSRIQEIGKQIEADYADSEDLLMVCILKGSYMFMSDLSRACKIAHMVDFMAVSSYGDETKSSGAVRIALDLRSAIEGRDVIIVEDIVDTGLTLSYLLENLKARKPKSLKVVSLLSKPARHKVHVPVDYLGFEVPDEFVIGYGLDFAQLYRNLPYVAVLKPEVFS
ncbi:MAG: hypoxanthine phosphoribosyltransferase [Anaerolineae bacterium]